MHGVYKPGAVKLRPSILADIQKAVGDAIGKENPFDLVFHGGSGSTEAEIAEAVDNGVIKMNIDTDTQYAFSRPVADHFFRNYDGVLKVDGEVGNKKAYDPRAWGKLAEAGMAAAPRRGRAAAPLGRAHARRLTSATTKGPRTTSGALRRQLVLSPTGWNSDSSPSTTSRSSPIRVTSSRNRTVRRHPQQADAVLGPDGQAGEERDAGRVHERHVVGVDLDGQAHLLGLRGRLLQLGAEVGVDLAREHDAGGVGADDDVHGAGLADDPRALVGLRDVRRPVGDRAVTVAHGAPFGVFRQARAVSRRRACSER